MRHFVAGAGRRCELASRESELGQKVDTTRKKPDGLILCGGAGRRVGGHDKGLLRVGDEAAVLLAARLLLPLCRQLFVSANRNLDIYAGLGVGPVIADRRTGFAGPLAGLEAAAGEIAGERLLILPCDLPALPSRVPKRLLEVLDSNPACDVAYARAAGRDHYLVAAARRRALAAVSATLDRGRNAVRDWLGSVDARAVDFGDEADAFRNRNSLADWDPT